MANYTDTLDLELIMFCEFVKVMYRSVFSCLLDTEADLTEIVDRVQKSAHQAVTEIEVQLF